MTRVKLLVGLSGMQFTWAPGDITDFDDPYAQQLIRAGYAELAPTNGLDPAPDCAAIESPENASLKRPRKRKV